MAVYDKVIEHQASNKYMEMAGEFHMKYKLHHQSAITNQMYGHMGIQM